MTAEYWASVLESNQLLKGVYINNEVTQTLDEIASTTSGQAHADGASLNDTAGAVKTSSSESKDGKGADVLTPAEKDFANKAAAAKKAADEKVASLDDFKFFKWPPRAGKEQVNLQLQREFNSTLNNSVNSFHDPPEVEHKHHEGQR